jgi:hypothetical protein
MIITGVALCLDRGFFLGKVVARDP